MIYQGDPTKLGPPINTNRYIIYVNGMATAPDYFKLTCYQLSSLFSCRVVGVFNQSDGILLDVVQCMSDYQDIVFNAGAHSFPAFIGGVCLGLFPFSSLLHLEKTNPATSRLFQVLALYGPKWPSKPICIVAHSQGNLIASNALFTLAKWLTKNKLSCPWMRVFALASPAPAWPESQLAGLNVMTYTNLDDPVPLLRHC